MKNTLLFLLFSLVSTISAFAQWNWLEQHTPLNSQSRYYNAVTTDKNNDSYTVGNLLNAGVGSCPGGILISKRQASGTLIYEQTYVSNNGICDEYGLAVAAEDITAKLVVGGQEDGHPFLGFFDSNSGTFINKAIINNNNYGLISGIKLHNNLVYVCGSFSGQITFGSSTAFSSAGNYDGFIAVFDLNANFQQALHISSNSEFLLHDIHTDQTGGIYVSASTKASATFQNSGNTTYSKGSGFIDLVLFKLNHQFDLIWGNKIATSNYAVNIHDYWFPIELSNDDSAVFGAPNHQDLKQSKLVKLESSTGTVLATQNTVQYQVGYDIAVDCDNLYMTGWNLTSKPCGMIAFLAQHSLSDLSQNSIGYSSQCGVGSGIHTDQTDHIILVGSYNSASFSWGSQSVSGVPAGWDAYIGKYLSSSNCCPNNLTLTSPSDDIYASIQYEADQYIIASNTIFGGADAEYDAGNYIELKAGFSAEIGSVFEAYIDGCGGLRSNGGNATEQRSILEEEMQEGKITLSSIDIYPNPFRTQTTISYELSQSSHVRVGLFDAQGREIRVLLSDTVQEAGKQQLILNSEDLSAGLYYCQLQIGDQLFSERLVLVE